MNDSLLPELASVSLLQGLPEIPRALAAVDMPKTPRAMSFASSAPAIILARPFVRRMADARELGDVDAFDLARTDMMATMSTATALDLLSAHDLGKAAKSPAVQRLASGRMSASVAALLGLAWLTNALRPDVSVGAVAT